MTGPTDIRAALAAELRLRAGGEREQARIIEKRAVERREMAEVLDQVAELCEKGEVDGHVGELLRAAKPWPMAAIFEDEREVDRLRRIFGIG